MYEGENVHRDVGSCINDFHFKRVLDYLQENHGGHVLCGDIKTVDSSRSYIPPTIIENPSLDSKLMTEEIFGPLLVVLKFSDIQHVIDYINANDKPLAI